MGKRSGSQGEAFSQLAASEKQNVKQTLTADTPAAVTVPSGARFGRCYPKADTVHLAFDGEDATTDDMPVGVAQPEWVPVAPDDSWSIISASDGDVIWTWLF